MYERSRGGLTLGGDPTKLVFVGIRKLIKVGTSLDGKIDNEPTDGVEITYSDMETKDRRDLTRLAHGKPIRVLYIE